MDQCNKISWRDTKFKLTYMAHTSCTQRETNHLWRQLSYLKSSTTTINLALIVHKSLPWSILAHGSPVLGYAAETHINKITRIFK